MGTLKDELKERYDAKPTTVSSMIEINEIVDRIAKSEYYSGYRDGIGAKFSTDGWIDLKLQGEGYEPGERYECPGCGNMVSTNVYKYCPHCGRRNREENERAD